MPREEVPSAISETLGQVMLSEHKNKKVLELSGGMK